jgi:hypothetical protein
MAMFRKSGDLPGMAFGHQNAAGAAYLFNDLSRTQYHAQRSLTLYEELGDAHGANSPRSRLADVARQRGDLDQAAALYKEAVVGWRNVGQYGAMARCLECLAFIAHDLSQKIRAEERTQWLRSSTSLLGAADAFRQAYNSPMNVFERREYDERLARIQKDAGDSLFTETWRMGQDMDPDQAILSLQEFQISA